MSFIVPFIFVNIVHIYRVSIRVRVRVRGRLRLGLGLLLDFRLVLCDKTPL